MTFKELRKAAASQGELVLDVNNESVAADWSALDDKEIKIIYYWYHGMLTWYQYNIVREGFETGDMKKILLIRSFVPNAFPNHACIMVDGECIGWLYINGKESLWKLITDNESEAG